MGPIGVPELLILLAVLLVIFGPKRLPQLGRQLGSGMREFKDSVTAKSGHDDEDDDPPRKALTKAEAPADVAGSARADAHPVAEDASATRPRT